LKELDVSENRLTSLPGGIKNLTNLKKLNLRNNRIQELSLKLFPRYLQLDIRFNLLSKKEERGCKVHFRNLALLKKSDKKILEEKP
jgi:Leucine-rich repeat (LRR) protein